MNLLKAFSFLLIFTSVSSFAKAERVKLCLTGRIVKSIKSYGESFENAAILAKAEFDKTNNVDIVKFYYDNLPLAAVDTYKKMENAGCSAIIGFSYLSDLLLVNNKIENIDIPIFTPYATSNDLSGFSSNIFFFRPNQAFLAKQMMSFLKKRSDQIKDVLVVTDISRSQTMDYKSSYSQILTEHKINFDSFDVLENDPNLISKLKVKTSKKEYRYIFLLAGAITSSKIANSLSDKNIVFIGTENFGSSTSKSFLTRLHNKKIKSFFCRNLSYLDMKNTKLQKFSKKYEVTFSKLPTLLSAYTFDAMKMIITASSTNKKLSMKNILQSNYAGITGVKINNHKNLKSDNYAILSVEEDGYKLVTQ